MTLSFDEAAAKRVETSYLTRDVSEQRRQVLESLCLQPGESVLDIGSGPGLLAGEMATAVGPHGSVIGIDISPSMLSLAARRAAPVDAAPIAYQQAGVDALPCPDSSIDVAVSTQVLEYVEDIPGALAEIARALRPGGRALVLDTDWDSIVWHSTDVTRMQRLLAVWDEHLVDPHLPRTLGVSLERAGFQVERPWIIPLLNVGYAEATYSGGLIPTIAAFVTGRSGITGDDVQEWAADLRALGPRYFFSLNRYVFLARKPT
ncbi:hypothetical protein BH24ACT9_BH24ACT9_12740 [soil metagenome]